MALRDFQHRYKPGSDLVKAGLAFMRADGRLSDVAMTDRDSHDILRGLEELRNVERTANPISAGSSPWNGGSMASSEFVNVSFDASLVGRLPMSAGRPFGVATLIPGCDASAAWTAESDVKQVCELSIDRIVLPPRKVVSVTVLTDDLLRASPIDAEAAAQSAMTRATVLALDSAFVSASAPSSSTPSGIFYGCPTVSSTGTTVAQISADLANVVDELADASIPLIGAVWVMSPRAYAFLRLMKIAGADGTVAGFNVLTSDAAAGVCGLIASQLVVLARDDVVQLSVATHASVAMGSGTINLWQVNARGLMVELWANWQAAVTDSTGSPLCACRITSASWA
jgi:hypothetical protein